MGTLHGILNLTKNLKIKFKLPRINVCDFEDKCLNLDKIVPMSENEVENLNWLLISDGINQIVLLTTLKFFNDIGPNYLKEVFQWSTESNRTLRNNFCKLAFYKTAAGQSSLSFLKSSKRNKYSKFTKKLNDIISLKYNFNKTLPRTSY